jgi:hypothetical protein
MKWFKENIGFIEKILAAIYCIILIIGRENLVLKRI